MSLVLAFIGIRGSVVAGDKREIILWGDPQGTDQFEKELYSGEINTDEQMQQRALALQVHLRVRDTKTKVWGRDGILIGEVSDFELGAIRKRRLYVTCGRYALAEIEGKRFVRVQHGEASRFVVLGNPFAQQIANRCIRERWKGGGDHEAAGLMETILKTVAEKSASVSQEYNLIRTPDTIDLEPILDRDRKNPD
jgi:hypothetical protein